MKLRGIDEMSLDKPIPIAKIDGELYPAPGGWGGYRGNWEEHMNTNRPWLLYIAVGAVLCMTFVWCELSLLKTDPLHLTVGYFRPAQRAVLEAVPTEEDAAQVAEDAKAEKEYNDYKRQTDLCAPHFFKLAEVIAHELCKVHCVTIDGGDTVQIKQCNWILMGTLVK